MKYNIFDGQLEQYYVKNITLDEVRETVRRFIEREDEDVLAPDYAVEVLNRIPTMKSDELGRLLSIWDYWLEETKGK